MISTFNLIVRRGHVPREQAIIRLMQALNLEVTSNVGTDADDGVAGDALSGGSDENEGDCEMEGGESECSWTDDETVPVDEGKHGILA